MIQQIGASVFLILSGFFGVQIKTVPVTTQKANGKLQIIQATSTNPIGGQTQKITSKVTQKIQTNTKKVTTIKKSVVTKPTTQPVAEVPIQTEPQIPTEVLNEFVRKTVVNILCSVGPNGPLSPVSGSGVIVSGDGIILTNAHLAQYFLLKNFNNQKDYISCVIRTGNPAYPTYNAELLYISPTWISNNKTLLLDTSPKGTGEHDYAFLRITSKINSSDEVKNLPHLVINLSENNIVDTSVLLASYPAGFLGGLSIIQNLYQSSTVTSIKNIFTFSTTTIDLLSLGGSIVAQKGSSGGAVTNSKGQLIGLISTESESEKTSDRDLRAITMAYINRDLKDESGQNMQEILSSPEAYAKNFNEIIAPKLTELLTNALLRK